MNDTSIKFKIYDQNIRYATTDPVNNEKLWSERKFELVKSIQFNTFDSNHAIVTLQEVLYIQLEDILLLLNEQNDDKWTYFGVGRLDGDKDGEFAPILYKKSQFELMEGGNFWLSETPDVPSRGWDANQERIVSWVQLKPIGGNATFNVFNTHFDHIGVVAREESAKLIAKKIDMNADGFNFITGDFNSKQEEKPHQYLSHIFKDSRSNNILRYGYDLTYTGFGNDNEYPAIIDYVFIDPRLEKVDAFGVLANHFDGIYSSDHRPVLIEIQF